MKRSVFITLFCALCFILNLGQSFAAKKIPVIVATGLDPDPKNYVSLTYYKMAELANQYSDGAFDFKLFPNSQLGDEVETMRAMQMGTVNIAVAASNNYAVFAPSVGWVNMPYLFDSLEEFRYILDRMWDLTNEWSIKEGGGRLLALIDVGYRHLTTNAKHPVRNLSDAKGIKIRTPQNPLMVSTFKALGLEPTAIAWSETFNALQQGVVDGQEACFNNFVTNKLYEAQKYATEIGWAVHGAAFVANEKWLVALTEKQRNAIIRAGREAMEYERTQVAGILERDEELMRQNGVELLGVVEDLDEWVRLGRTAWPKCYEVIGAGNAERGKMIVDMALSMKK